MKKLILLPVLFALLISNANLVSAQSAEIRDVRKREFRGVHAIVNKETGEAAGYYTFYVNEKVGGGMINFVIAIYDLELKLIKQTPITISKRSTVDGSEFNGKDFMFVFKDVPKKKLTYVTVDSKGGIIKTKGIVEKKFAATTSEVYPSANDAFYIVKPIKEKKWGYSVAKTDRNINTLWEKRFMPEKGFVGVEAIESGGDRIIVVQLIKPSALSKKGKGEIVCMDDKSGNILYKYPLFDGVVTNVPSAFLIDSKGNIVTGGMYFAGERMSGKNSDGLFFLKLSPEGKKLTYTRVDWDAGIQELLKATSRKFAIGSKPKVFFHDIVESEDGGYQIISETFRKSMPGISSRLKDLITGRYIGDITQDSKPLNFTVMDFIIFNYDESGKMNNINKIAKDYTKVVCYYPYNSVYYGGLKLAKVVKSYGFFDYAFTTTLPDSKQEVMISRNMVSANPHIGITSIEVGKESETHKIPIKRGTARMTGKAASFIGAIKSKPGYLCVYYYDKKEQTVHLYLEKIQM
ncbi:MAG: hypothetical protein FVQ77_10780 [Cytophagales bacterium]|nr:hypothetical protein [Cytophagales bacterium]